MREVTHQSIRARRPDREPRQITKVISIPHAYNQCRGFIREHLGTSSTRRPIHR